MSSEQHQHEPLADWHVSFGLDPEKQQLRLRCWQLSFMPALDWFACACGALVVPYRLKEVRSE